MTLEEAVEQIERVSEGRNLLGNLKLIKNGSWQTSQEVFRDWNNGALVEGVSTANLAIYRLVHNEVVFDLLSREGNPFCDEKFQKEAYDGIIGNELFSPRTQMKKHIMEAIDAGQSVTVCYSNLRIQTKDCSSYYCYVEIDGDDTQEEKKLFKGVYGTKNPVREERVYLLRENVVRNQLQGNEDGLVVQACYFDDFQNFVADDLDIDFYDNAVRGVRRRDVTEGDAKKNEVPCAPQETDSVRTAYNTLGRVTRGSCEKITASRFGNYGSYFSGI